MASSASSGYLELQPQDTLRFGLSPSGQTRTTLKLTNTSDHKVAFKVRRGKKGKEGDEGEDVLVVLRVFVFLVLRNACLLLKEWRAQNQTSVQTRTIRILINRLLVVARGCV
jgi:hypothetical protein